MKHSGQSKFVRAFALAILLLSAFAAIPRGGGERHERASSRFLDLLPNVTRGLDLIAGESFGGTIAEARIGVWNGERVVPMALEDYIIGVTAAEMPASYDIEALKAQAIAARTFAVKHMTGELRCKSGHTICTDHTCCQAFITVERMKRNWGDNFGRYYEKLTEAVHGTENMVLMSGGRLVTALYHSSSGGRTEDCEAVFAVALPYLVSVESEGEEDSPEYRTVSTYSLEEFTERINEAFPDSLMTDPKNDVDVWQRTDSGRISLIRLGGTVITGQQLRNALKLRSTNAEFSFDDGGVTITCLGFGHGVGMSQCGANAMAKEGADHEEILKHYYTGVEIVRFEPSTPLSSILSPSVD